MNAEANPMIACTLEICAFAQHASCTAVSFCGWSHSSLPLPLRDWESEQRPIILGFWPQVNFLGHWLLAHELLSHQRSRRREDSSSRIGDQGHAPKEAQQHGSEKGTRVIFLSSTTHRAGRLDFADLQLARPGAYSGFRGYADSKLACLIGAKELQRRLDR